MDVIIQYKIVWTIQKDRLIELMLLCVYRSKFTTSTLTQSTTTHVHLNNNKTSKKKLQSYIIHNCREFLFICMKFRIWRNSSFRRVFFFLSLSCFEASTDQIVFGDNVCILCLCQISLNFVKLMSNTQTRHLHH